VLMMIGLFILVNRTLFGKSMRAVASDREAAEMLGIDVNRVVALTFFIGSALAGIAGVMSGLNFEPISSVIGFLAGLKAFTAAVVGGIGSIPGAMIGGLVIGLCESFSSSYISSQYSDLIVFGILIATMLVRPQGVFGQPPLQKV
jgi:branched-chain amino acid transport system permease protein